jgi:hypothetical protein
MDISAPQLVGDRLGDRDVLDDTDQTVEGVKVSVDDDVRHRRGVPAAGNGELTTR